MVQPSHLSERRTSVDDIFDYLHDEILSLRLRPGDKTVLEPGMTFHFMTGLWMEGWGYETTESIVITEREPELFCNIPRRMLVKT